MIQIILPIELCCVRFPASAANTWELRCLLFFRFLSLEDGPMNMTFMGPCIANVFSSIINKIQRYTIYLFP